MLMHVCPAGHEGLMLRHSLISTAGSPGDTWLSEEGFPTPDGWGPRGSPLCPLRKTTAGCGEALDQAAASCPAPGPRQRTPPETRPLLTLFQPPKPSTPPSCTGSAAACPACRCYLHRVPSETHTPSLVTWGPAVLAHSTRDVVRRP